MSLPRPVRAATPPKAATKEPAKGCSMGALFHLLGESHVLDILYFLLSEAKPRRFVDLQRELKMSPNTLTDRLQGLVRAGLLTRTAYNEIPPRVEYAPTPKALKLGAVFGELSEWATKNTLEPEPVLAN